MAEGAGVAREGAQQGPVPVEVRRPHQGQQEHGRGLFPALRGRSALVAVGAPPQSHSSQGIYNI